MIRHGVNVKVTPLRVHLYSKSNYYWQRARKNNAHKRQKKAKGYSFLLYQTLHPIVRCEGNSAKSTPSLQVQSVRAKGTEEQSTHTAKRIKDYSSPLYQKEIKVSLVCVPQRAIFKAFWDTQRAQKRDPGFKTG